MLLSHYAQQQIPVCRMVRGPRSRVGAGLPPLPGSPSLGAFRGLLCLLENTSGNRPGRTWAARPRQSLPQTRTDYGVSGEPRVGEWGWGRRQSPSPQDPGLAPHHPLKGRERIPLDYSLIHPTTVLGWGAHSVRSGSSAGGSHSVSGCKGHALVTRRPVTQRT